MLIFGLSEQSIPPAAKRGMNTCTQILHFTKAIFIIFSNDRGVANMEYIYVVAGTDMS